MSALSLLSSGFGNWELVIHQDWISMRADENKVPFGLIVTRRTELRTLLLCYFCHALPSKKA